MTARLIYINDPLCGWCYAMRPALEAMRRALPQLPVTCLNSGLFVGADARLMPEGFRDHLQKGVPNVEALTGARFGQAFHDNVINNDDFVYETGIVAQAAQVVKQLQPDFTLEFIFASQDSFFGRGETPHDPATYLPLVADFGIDARTFINHFYAATTAAATKAEFAQAQMMLGQFGAKTIPLFAIERHGETTKFDHEQVRLPDEFVAALKEALA